MKHLTKDELRRLFEVARAHSHRNWLILLVGYCHGMRASEIVGSPGWRENRGKKYWYEPLRGVDIRDGEIVVRRLKGSLKCVHPLFSSTDPLFDEKSALENFVKNNSGVLFPIHRTTFWRFFQGYQEAAGIKKTLAHPHVLKHSIAMHSKDAGLEMVQTYIGHSNINNTRKFYWEISDDEAAKAVARVVKL